MRLYRTELTGEATTFITYFEAINEYEARHQARVVYPCFTVTKITETMPKLEA